MFFGLLLINLWIAFSKLALLPEAGIAVTAFYVIHGIGIFAFHIFDVIGDAHNFAAAVKEGVIKLGDEKRRERNNSDKM